MSCELASCLFSNSKCVSSFIAFMPDDRETIHAYTKGNSVCEFCFVALLCLVTFNIHVQLRVKFTKRRMTYIGTLYYKRLAGVIQRCYFGTYIPVALVFPFFICLFQFVLKEEEKEEEKQTNKQRDISVHLFQGCQYI